ncbi:MAG: tRNA (cytidine(34)-2'-O)-methyltransferase [Planctomycetota bacterium]|nr:MAG: tRNA (cytidine(34)-2'-O)-methyltransferase [Planctomycetota bacterium]
MYEPRFHVVLYQPEIAYNAGAVGRTCVACAAKLWLVRPLGFRITDRHLRRAGLDYWPYLEWEVVDDWERLRTRLENHRFWFLSKRGRRTYCEATFAEGDVFVFGAESTGLPGEMLARHRDESLRIPIRPDVRSLNLSVSAGIVLFEASRQVGFLPETAPDSL